MEEEVIFPRGAGNRELLAGDRVVYTSRSRIFQGILTKVNPSKSVVTETDSNWVPRIKGYRTVTTIDNVRIFKTNE